MTEQEWQSCAEPERMLSFLCYSGRPRVSERKQRLFAAACCRRIWALMDRESRQAVEVAERLADGQASAGEWEAAQRPVAERGWDEGGLEAVDYPSAAASASGWGYDPDVTAALATVASGTPDESAAQLSLLRDL